MYWRTKFLLGKNFTNGSYCDENFAKFNFANHMRYPPGSSGWNNWYSANYMVRVQDSARVLKKKTNFLSPTLICEIAVIFSWMKFLWIYSVTLYQHITILSLTSYILHLINFVHTFFITASQRPDISNHSYHCNCRCGCFGALSRIRTWTRIEKWGTDNDDYSYYRSILTDADELSTKCMWKQL